MDGLMYFPGQKKIIRRSKVKAFILGFIIAAFIFTGLGYSWRIVQVEDEYEARIAKLKSTIEYYRNNWAPIRHKEAKKK